jgi:hypothetical protein
MKCNSSSPSVSSRLGCTHVFFPHRSLGTEHICFCCQAPITSHGGEEGWLKRPPLHAGMKRVGGGIIWRLEGIARRLRKRVEN